MGHLLRPGPHFPLLRLPLLLRAHVCRVSQEQEHKSGDNLILPLPKSVCGMLSAIEMLAGRACARDVILTTTCARSILSKSLKSSSCLSREHERLGCCLLLVVSWGRVSVLCWRRERCNVCCTQGVRYFVQSESEPIHFMFENQRNTSRVPSCAFSSSLRGGDNVGERVYTQSMVSSPARGGEERGRFHRSSNACLLLRISSAAEL